MDIYKVGFAPHVQRQRRLVFGDRHVHVLKVVVCFPGTLSTLATANAFVSTLPNKDFFMSDNPSHHTNIWTVEKKKKIKCTLGEHTLTA